MKHLSQLKKNIFVRCLHAFLVSALYCLLSFFLFSCTNLGSAVSGTGSSVPSGMCGITVDTALACRSAFPSTVPDTYTYYATIHTGDNATYFTAAGTSSTASYLKNSGTAAAPQFLFKVPRNYSSGDCYLTLYGFATSAEPADYTQCTVSGTSAAFSLTAAQESISTAVTVFLTGITESGSGSVSLKLTMSAALAAKVTAASEVTAKLGSTALTAAISDTTTVTLTGSDIAAGAYTLLLLFTDSSGNVIPTDFAGQAVQVFPGMTTDVWYDNSTTPITSLPVAIASTIYYVGGSDGVLATNGITASDTNSGLSIASPFASVQTAVDKIIASNDGSSTYYLYIDGQVTGLSGIVSISSLTKPLTLIIAGLNSNNTKDIVSASGVSGKNVFYLAGATGAALTVTIKNLGITGASNEYGGGINCNNFTTLVLDGTHVYGNTASYGGGIYADGSLTLQNGTVIGDSTQTTAATESSCSNRATCNSAGICSNGTLVIKSGCYVAYNYNDCSSGSPQDAGGVRATGSSFTLESGAYIQYNGTGSSGGTNTNGGGLAVEGASTAATVQGTIRGNTATGNGGGLYASAGSITMSGTISGNSAGTGKQYYITIGATYNGTTGAPTAVD